MKITITQKHNLSFFLLALSMGLMLDHACFASASPVRNLKDPLNEEEPAKKTKTRSFASMNNSSVKIYPDVLKRNMHVVAKENDGKEVDFFVFDLEGTLMQNFRMKPRDHIRVGGLARGSYVYRVFSGDEETATGKFEIR